MAALTPASSASSSDDMRDDRLLELIGQDPEVHGETSNGRLGNPSSHSVACHASTTLCRSCTFSQSCGTDLPATRRRRHGPQRSGERRTCRRGGRRRGCGARACPRHSAGATRRRSPCSGTCSGRGGRARSRSTPPRRAANRVRSTTYALTASPVCGCGTPMTPTSRTSGWVISISSTSAGIHVEPRHDDQILDPVDEVQVPVVVGGRHVARAQPAVVGETAAVASGSSR